ncbi:N-acetylmuramic acid 6-phosphate etherase [Candidatus Bipolaricaulota bacterium]|nr:N-acetylmuramic acid 6-phosphate etherase [Candidatus Bipolaricaulota bacterium]
METEERNENARNLHEKSTEQILKIINREDQKVASAVEAVLPKIETLVAEFVKTYENGGDICYIGAGTSGRIGVLDASEIPPTFRVPSNRIRGLIAGGKSAFASARESEEDDRQAGYNRVKQEMSEGDFLIGVSASGETPFVLGGLKRAEEIGITTAAITSNENPSVEKIAETTVVVETGPEVIAGSTRMKAGTAQKMILNMISTTAMVNLGKVYDNFMVDVVPTNKKLKRRAIRALQSLTDKDEEEIQSVLQQSGYEVKPALISLKFGIPVSDAREALSKNDGFLGPAMEEFDDKG